MTGTLGRFGEEWTVGYLSRHGYQIVDRNVRFRTGEIDIVARDGATLVFVEVKCRRGNRFGAPVESITRRRFAHLESAILSYLSARGLEEHDYRVDVMSIEVDTSGRVARHNLLQAVASPES